MTTASAPAPLIGDAQTDVVDFLTTAAAGSQAERIDTHAASVFLTGDRAWKLKRAIDFGYLDFSTADRRKAALETELRLNRRSAPSLYLGVHAITRDVHGKLAIDGDGPAVDWVLEMRRFPDDALFDRMADRGALDEQLLIRLADRIHTFHAAADIVLAKDGAAAFRRIIRGNLASMAMFPDILDPPTVRQLGTGLLALATHLAPLLDLRARSGRVRHGHGDLHLANIAMIDGAPTLFDCLEFSPELAKVDVLYDLAFLIMDLWHRGLRGQANLVFNRYLDLSAADEGGIALIPLFLSVRAGIRAHVLAAQSKRAGGNHALDCAARAHLELAVALLQSPEPRLIAIGGLSGTGKSALARALAGHIGRAPGARILRTDILRKRLAGVPPETTLPRRRYTPAQSVHVYRALDRMASLALAQGSAVLADAVFAVRKERDRIESVARAAGFSFDGLWLEASMRCRTGRIAGRVKDASDADVAVAQAQTDLVVGELGNWRTLNADSPLPDVVAAGSAILGLRA